MSEEIKEIYQDDEELIVRYKDGTFRTFNDLTIDVLNYITNLQQRVEQLEKENEHLDNELNNMTDYAKDLENIRKEAMDYVKNNLTLVSILDGKKSYCLNDYSFDYVDLLNILNKGSEKNE